jgi:hypothetical protein
MHAMPWARLYGRKYARTVIAGLRKIFRTDWDSLRKLESEESISEVVPVFAAGSDSTIVARRGFRCGID